MDRLIEIGVLPLIGLGFQRLGKYIGAATSWFITLLIGKRKGIEGDAASGALYIATSIIALIGTAALVAISFSGSFAAASAFAQESGIDSSVAAFIPLSIDGLIVVSIIILFSLSLAGQKANILTIVIIVFTGLSVYINIQHIDESVNVINRYIVGAVFPITVFLTSELVSFSLRRTTAYISKLKTFQQLVELVTSLKATETETEIRIEAMNTQAGSLQAQINDYQTTVTNLERDLAILAVSANYDEATAETIERRVQIIRVKEADPKTTQVQLAELLGTSQKTISRDISELSGIVMNGNSKNGRK